MKRVKIKKVGGESHHTPFNQLKNKSTLSNSPFSSNKTLKPVEEEEANVEVEKGEVVISNFMEDGIPESYIAGGKRHSQGGTPLALPDNSFIFSDTKSLKIKDKELLKEFGMSKSATPAGIAKKYDFNKYKTILLNPDSDKKEIETAEKMIANYNQKIGKLALVQESMKGFKNGAPKIAEPYMLNNNIDPAMFTPQVQEPEGLFKTGGEKKRRVKLVKYANGGEGDPKETIENYDENKSYRPGSLVTFPDGTTKRISYAERRGQLEDLESTLRNLSPKAKQQLLEKTLNQIRDSKAKNLKSTDRDAAITKYENNPDALIDDLLAAQNQVYKLTTLSNSQSLAAGEKNKSIDDVTNGKGYKELIKIANENGLDLTVLTALPIIAHQAGFRALNDLQGMSGFENIQTHALGFADEGVGGDENVSAVDSIFGDTTAFQQVMSNTQEAQFEDYESPATIADVPQTKLDVPENNKIPAQYWKQDILGMGNAYGNLASLKKYLPWSAPVDLEQADPTFLDPSRSIAAITEATGAASQGINPNDIASRLRLQGASASQVANVMGNYDNKNVSIANQFAQSNAAIGNQESMMQAARKTSDFDKNTIANQQFDNSKRKAKAELTKQYQNAITNKWKTDAMNQLFPNFQVDAAVGGRGYYSGQTKELDGKSQPEGMSWKDHQMAAMEAKLSIEDYVKLNNLKEGGTMTNTFKQRKMQHFLGYTSK